jgi:hypothetical protein
MWIQLVIFSETVYYQVKVMDMINARKNVEAWDI